MKSKIGGTMEIFKQEEATEVKGSVVGGSKVRICNKTKGGD